MPTIWTDVLNLSSPLVTAGCNIFTVALLVVEGDEKGIQCLGYNWATLSLRDRDLVLHIGGLDARLTTLICEKIIVANSKGVKTG
jgi:hypothetical protein